MPNTSLTVGDIQEIIRFRNYRLSLHAIERIARRRISVSDIEEALLSNGAEIIENYPNDPRGPSCLVLGFLANAIPLHIQCTYPPSVVIVTAYGPSPEEWRNWRVRT